MAESIPGIWTGETKYQSMFLCSSFEDTTEKILKPVSELMKTPSGVILRFKKNILGQYPIEAATYVLPRKTINSYTEFFFKEDPIAAAAFKDIAASSTQSCNRIVPLFNLVDRSDFKQSIYYNEFLRVNDLADVLAMFVGIEELPEEVFCLAVQRWKGMPEFSSEDFAAFQRLRPLMSLCLANIALRETVQMIRSAGGDIARGGSLGLTVWDEHLRLIYSAGSALSDLQLDREEQRAEWLKWLHEVIAVNNAAGILFDGQINGMHIRIERTILQGRSRYSVISSSTAQNRALRQWAERCKLTAREVEVCTYVLSGLTNESISYQMNISQKTVQNHVISIFAKFRVNSRSQLTARIMGWERWRPPSPDELNH